jgi:hypothetical protein
VVSNLLLVSLTRDQALIITRWLKHAADSDSGTDDADPLFVPERNEIEIPIQNIPSPMLNEPELATYRLNSLLAYLMESAIGRTSITLPYRYDPYMYLPRPVPREVHLMDESMPVFRIGNSLLSGDATAATGISTQFQLLLDIVRHLGQQYFLKYR